MAKGKMIIIIPEAAIPGCVIKGLHLQVPKKLHSNPSYIFQNWNMFTMVFYTAISVKILLLDRKYYSAVGY